MKKDTLLRLQDGAKLIRSKCLHKIWWYFTDIESVVNSKYVSKEFKEWVELENFYVSLLAEYKKEMEAKGLALTGHPLQAHLKSSEDGINLINDFESIELDGSGICYEIHFWRFECDRIVLLSDRYLMESIIKDGKEAITTFELDSILNIIHDKKGDCDIGYIIDEIQKINKVFYGVITGTYNQ